MTFASEYEFLCSELSILWLKIKLWGQSIGLDVDPGHLQSTLSARPEVEATISQCVANIVHLLNEIEVIRRKYEFRPPLIPETTADSTDEKVPSTVSLGALSNTRAVTTLRHRIRENQKQKSCLSIVKWTICDAKKFEEKVKQLRTLVDGLEDISAAAGITRSLPTSAPDHVVPTPSENPPPYSLRSSLPDPSIPQPTEPIELPSLPNTPTTQDPEVAAHYTAMMRHCGLSSRAQDHPRCRARDKMSRLTSAQFKELRTDIYDEMFRREMSASTPPSLTPHLHYHPKRNQAREKLSSLPRHRFKDLVVDVLMELERRFPGLPLEGSPNSAGVSMGLQSSFSLPNSVSPVPNRRYGCIYPPPLLQHRSPHPASASTTTIPLSRFSQGQLTPPQLGTSRHPEIFKSFRVCSTDPTHKVLPAALKKYAIEENWRDYALYVLFGDGEERCLGLEEQPLMVFKELDRAGKKPMFMLRRVVPDSGVEGNLAIEENSTIGTAL